MRLFQWPPRKMRKLNDKRAERASAAPEPPPKPRGIAALDALSYPHIIDDVFAYADYETLLLLRRVSKAFCARADAILAEHVAMKLPGESVAQYEWLVSQFWDPRALGEGPRCRRLPVLYESSLEPGPKREATLRRVAACLSNVKILDFVLANSEVREYLFRTMTALQTVRPRGALAAALLPGPARTLCSYIDMESRVPRPLASEYELVLAGDTPDRLVVHITCGPNSQGIVPRLSITHKDGGALPREVVVICTSVVFTVIDQRLGHAIPVPVVFLHGIFHTVLKHPAVQFTLVLDLDKLDRPKLLDLIKPVPRRRGSFEDIDGIEETNALRRRSTISPIRIPHSCFSANNHDVAVFTAITRQLLAEYNKSPAGLRAPIPDAIFSRLNVVKLEEYRRRVGARQFIVETTRSALIPPPPSPPSLTPDTPVGLGTLASPVIL